MKESDMKPTLRITLLVCLLGAQCIQSVFAFDETAFRNASRQIQEASTQNNESALNSALDSLSKLSGQEPANPLLRAYLGSAETMQAKFTLFPWKKMEHCENGLAKIDKALQQLDASHDKALVRGVPLSLETRLIAANTFLALPDLFKRSQAGHKQLQAVLSSPLLINSPEGFRSSVTHLALKTAKADKLPADKIELLQKMNSAQASERLEVQTKLKDIWK